MLKQVWESGCQDLCLHEREHTAVARCQPQLTGPFNPPLRSGVSFVSARCPFFFSSSTHPQSSQLWRLLARADWRSDGGKAVKTMNNLYWNPHCFWHQTVYFAWLQNIFFLRTLVSVVLLLMKKTHKPFNTGAVAGYSKIRSMRYHKTERLHNQPTNVYAQKRIFRPICKLC